LGEAHNIVSLVTVFPASSMHPFIHPASLSHPTRLLYGYPWALQLTIHGFVSFASAKCIFFFTLYPLVMFSYGIYIYIMLHKCLYVTITIYIYMCIYIMIICKITLICYILLYMFDLWLYKYICVCTDLYIFARVYSFMDSQCML